mmetsp:Transcript_11746/g.49253  ORF Transcript_11746/g.49253 Transcript_11746/m.49253 type:complete len:218 (-) Transcript_11746:600-1253(-)
MRLATAFAVSPHAKNVTIARPATSERSASLSFSFSFSVASYSSIQHSGRNASQHTTFQTSFGQNVSRNARHIFTASDIWIASMASRFARGNGGSNASFVANAGLQCVSFNALIGAATMIATDARNVFPHRVFTAAPPSLNEPVTPSSFVSFSFRDHSTVRATVSSRTSSPEETSRTRSPRCRPSSSRMYSSPWHHSLCSTAVSRMPIVDNEHPKSLA